MEALAELQAQVDVETANTFFSGDLDDISNLSVRASAAALESLVALDKPAVASAPSWDELAFRRVAVALHAVVRARGDDVGRAAHALVAVLSVPDNHNAFHPIIVRDLFLLVQEDTLGPEALCDLLLQLKGLVLLYSVEDEVLHNCLVSAISELFKTLDKDTQCLNAAFGLLKALSRNAGEASEKHLHCVLQHLLSIVPLTHAKILSKPLTERSSAIMQFSISLLQQTDDDAASAVTFFEHLAARCPERSEHRRHCCGMLQKLLETLPQILARASAFIARLCHSGKAAQRVVACEMAATLVRLTLQQLVSDLDVAEPQPTACFLLLEALQARASDKLANVRARALQSLAEAVKLSLSSAYLRVQFAALLWGDVAEVPDVRRSGARSPFHQRCSGTRRILELLRRRAHDAKPLVRKAALLALTAVLSQQEPDDEVGIFVSRDDLQVYFDACQDTSPLLRKRALADLTLLLELRPDDVRVKLAWLGAVLPLYNDREPAVQSACLVVLQRVFIEPIAAGAHERERALALLDLNASSAQLQEAIRLLFQQEKPSSRFVKALNDSLQHDNVSLWCIAAEVAPASIHQAAVIAAYNRCDVQAPHRRFVLAVLGRLADHLPAESRHNISSELLETLLAFAVPVSALGGHMQCLSLLSSECWTESLLSKGQAALELHVLGSEALDTSSVLPRLLFSVGEAALHQKAPSQRLRRLSTLLQALSSSAVEAVRAQAFLSLGKLCLIDIALARRVIGLFICELDTGTSVIVRSNILVLLSDLCRTFTSIVDPHIDRISACLRDANATLRKHVLLVLMQLLQQDYIKWRGVLFFRFMSLYCDRDDAVASVAAAAIDTFVAVKSRRLFGAHFVEMLFYLNGFRDHPTFNRFANADEAVVDADRRRSVYNVMLANMTDEERFNTAAKLVHDVLGDVIDGAIAAEARNSASLLRDTLQLLASPNIKMRLLRRNAEEEALDELEGQMQAAKGRLLSQIMRKNIISNVIPIVLSFKRLLDQHHSPLKKEFMLYMKELFADYRSELDEFLASDKQLAAEIEFDMRQFEQKEQEEKDAQRSQAPMPLSPSCQTPLGNRQRRRSIEPGSRGSAFLTPRIRTPSSASGPCTPVASNCQRRPVAIGSFSTPVSPKRPTKVWKVQTPSFDVPRSPPSKKHGRKRIRQLNNENEASALSNTEAPTSTRASRKRQLDA